MKHIELMFIWLGTIFGVFTVLVHVVEQLNGTKYQIMRAEIDGLTVEQKSSLFYSDWLPLWILTILVLAMWSLIVFLIPYLYLHFSTDQEPRLPKPLRYTCYGTAALPLLSLVVLLATGVVLDIPAMT